MNKNQELWVFLSKSDFRDLDEAVKQGNDKAALALEVFAYQVKKFRFI